MTKISIEKIPSIRKEITLPGDKSISHRAVMLSSIADGDTLIENFLSAQDCMCTASAFKEMGVEIKQINEQKLQIKGVGLRGLSKQKNDIYLGNSGTSMRLLLGILAGQESEYVLTGDESLSRRPMKRVTHPLRQMGAHIEGRDDANFAPIKIKGGRLHSIDYKLPVSSAQVKSCIMLASLYSDGVSNISEPGQSRDHTERMYKLFNADISVGRDIKVRGIESLKSPGRLKIPSDISSAAFFIGLALLLPDSELLIKSCGVNPTRIGFIDTLKRMGADIVITNMQGEDFEPYADIIVKTSTLKSITINPDEIPKMIDEIPVLALVSAFAHGETRIKGIGELRVKETDRVNSMVTNLRAMGVDIKSEQDDMVIKGPNKLKPAKVTSYGDHRTAMTMIIAGSIPGSHIVIDDIDCIDTSFPGFMQIIQSLYH